MASATVPRGRTHFGYQRTAYLYLLPALVLYSSFVAFPFGRTVWLSFHGGTGMRLTRFVGLANYRDLLNDPVFWEAFKHNVAWAAMTLTLPVAFGLFLAVLLARARLLGRTVFRTVLFLPQVMTSVIVAMVWRWMYNPSFGPVNEALRRVGLDSLARGWLGDRHWALPALALGYSWAYYGFCMVVFVAALQGVDETLYDAAKIDGANAIQEFWHITVPGIRFAIATVLLFTLIESFKVFDIVFVGTRGGPGYSTWVLSYYLYDYTWTHQKVGYGVTSAVVQTAFVALLSAAFLWYRRRTAESMG
jgi:raffinose/stachyose/melibiose transport system permease protein